jgi:hypothetical protein
MGKGEVHTVFWLEYVMERNNLEDRLRSEDNIKMHLQEVGWGGMDWIALAPDRDR